MRTIILGDPKIPYSWKNDVVTEAIDLGWEVHTYPASQFTVSTEQILADASSMLPDLFIWPRWGVSVESGYRTTTLDMINQLRSLGVITVGIHQDLYWGRNDRLDDLLNGDWWRMDYIFTADGGHQKDFEDIGINHQWLIPPCPLRFAQRAPSMEKYEFDVVFVGGCQPVHEGRADLLKWAKSTYGSRFKWIGRTNAQQVWPPERNSIYNSAKVILGDSVTGSPEGIVWSDRVPTTLGAGGILVHPNTRGLGVSYDYHVEPYRRGDYDGLKRIIDDIIQLSPTTRELYRQENHNYIRTNHSWKNRLQDIATHILKDRSSFSRMESNR
jgi:hypothetical protein